MFELQGPQQAPERAGRVVDQVRRRVPIGPFAGIAHGIVAASIGRRDHQPGLRADQPAVEEAEQQRVGVAHVLEDVEHQDQVELVRNQFLDLLDDLHRVAVTLGRNPAGVVGQLDTEALPASLGREFQMAAVAASEIENIASIAVLGKTIQELGDHGQREVGLTIVVLVTAALSTFEPLRPVVVALQFGVRRNRPDEIGRRFGTAPNLIGPDPAQLHDPGGPGDGTTRRSDREPRASRETHCVHVAGCANRPQVGCGDLTEKRMLRSVSA